MKVVVFGYSENADRYSNICDQELKKYSHEVITINPRIEDDFSKIPTNYDTLTIYVNPQVSDKYQQLLLQSRPKRVIFNPGTENESLVKKFELLGVEVVVGCTLVMLRTNQFEN